MRVLLELVGGRGVNPRRRSAGELGRGVLGHQGGHPLRPVAATEATVAGASAEVAGLEAPSPADINREKTHCPKGHPLKGKNLIRLKSGKRRCRICHAETQARYRERKRKS